MQSSSDDLKLSRADIKMNSILADGSVAIKDAKKKINETYEINE